jgi:ferric-dicitrate binding protein FerR (iron transport regulator)
MTTASTDPESNDSSLEELLREVGARDEPSADAMRDVRAAVQAEWQAMVEERRRQRRSIAWRIAASLVLAVLIATFARRFVEPVPVQVASVVNIDGRMTYMADDADTRAGTVGQAVLVGETIQTDDSSRAALTFPSGLSLRIDHGTRFTVAAADRIELTSGALYIDAPSANASNDALMISTPAGSVRHVGTQYEVRTHANSIQVSVREGRVLVTAANGSNNTGEAGQMLRLSSSGELTRSALAATHPQWQWTMEAGPVFDIDNQTLSSFLQWIARETGRRVVYSSPKAEAAAAEVKLRGSIAGLDADAALAAVLSTTQLRRYRTPDEEIGIELADR